MVEHGQIIACEPGQVGDNYAQESLITGITARMVPTLPSCCSARVMMSTRSSVVRRSSGCPELRARLVRDAWIPGEFGCHRNAAFSRGDV